ncbi:MAG: T9SS type A sorting domain-containing protein [Ignavibacteriaceae bacterium]
MKQTLTILLVIMLACIAKSQTVFDSFDTFIDSNYVTSSGGVNDSSRIHPFEEHQIVSKGQGALGLKYKVEMVEAWGGSAILQLRVLEDTGVWDFSGYNSLSFSFNNKVPCSWPGAAQLRIILYDASDVKDIDTTSLEGTEWWYSFLQVLDVDTGWNKIVIPLKNVGSAAKVGNGGTGFWLTGQHGIEGNGKLDLNKIRGIGIEVFSQDPVHPDHYGDVNGEFILDNLELISNTTSVLTTDKIPEKFVLNQNYPNPFNPTTTIEFYLPKQSQVMLNVFNTLGQQVKSLINEDLSSGKHSVRFDASGLSSGVYLYRFQTNNFHVIKKMILAK